MCCLAFVPGGKALKGLKFADDIGKSTKNLRKNLIKATGKDPGKAAKATKYSRYMSEGEMLVVKRTGTMKSLSSHGTHIVPTGAPRTSIASKAQKMHGLGGKPDYRVDFNVVNDNGIRRVTSQVCLLGLRNVSILETRCWYRMLTL